MSYRKSASFAAGAVAFALAVSAYGAAGAGGLDVDGVSPRADENKLTLITRRDPGNWDITQTANTFLWLWLPGNVLETLWVLDDSGEPQPRLAESWEISDDQTGYTFQLRSGVTFHNGNPLTAADVVFSLQTLKDSPAAAVSTPLVAMESVEAVDEATVKVTLSEPSQAFFRGIGGVSGSIFSEAEFPNIATAPMGTGPYVFAEYQQDDHVRLDRYADYWGEPGTLDEVTVRMIPDNTAALNAITAGEADGYPALPDVLWERLDSEGFRDSYNVLVGEAGGSTSYIAFNTRIAPYDDLAFRQAVAHAIDRQQYADVFNAPWGVVTTCTFATADLPWFVPESEDDCPYPNDPDEASRLLDEAGNGGAEVDLTMTSGNDLADILRVQLETAGLSVELEFLETSQYLDQVLAGNPPDFGITLIQTPRGIEQFYCPDPARAPWNSFCDPDVTRLLAEADVAETPEQETELINQAMGILQEQAVIIPVMTFNNVALFHPELTGVEHGADVYMEINLAELAWK